jgi:hypothetical protein
MANSIENRTPFIAEILSGLIACCAVWLYQEESLALLLLFLIAWIVIFRKGLLTVAGAFLISLALDFYNKGQLVEFEGVARWIVIGIIIDIILLVVWPLLKNRSLPQASISEAAFFAMMGFVIAYAIQIRACDISVNVPGSPNDLNQVVSKMIACQQNYFLERLTHLPASNTSQYWNEIAQLILRLITMSPITWLCLMVSIRRISFNPTRLAELPRYFWRAIGGITLSGFLTLIIWGIISFAVYFGLGVIPRSDNPGATMNDLAFLLIAIDLFLSSLGAGWGTA